MNACFVSNHKRIDAIERDMQHMSGVRAILTSNLPAGGVQALRVNYDRYINGDSMISDNAGLMLLRLLERCGAQQVYLAGFDGFHHKHNGNYYSKELDRDVDTEQVQEKQRRIRRQLGRLAQSMNLRFLTPSVYQQEDESR